MKNRGALVLPAVCHLYISSNKPSQYCTIMANSLKSHSSFGSDKYDDVLIQPHDFIILLWKVLFYNFYRPVIALCERKNVK